MVDSDFLRVENFRWFVLSSRWLEFLRSSFAGIVFHFPYMIYRKKKEYLQYKPY